MNLINIAGHLGADPEVRFTSSGQKVTTIRVATKSRKGGKDDTIWWRVTVWGEQFDKMMPYFKKGSPIVAIGEMNKPEIFNDRNGSPQISMSLTAAHLMFSPFGKSEKSENQQANTSNAPASSNNKEEYAGFATGAQPVGEAEEYSIDDEIPF